MTPLSTALVVIACIFARIAGGISMLPVFGPSRLPRFIGVALVVGLGISVISTDPQVLVVKNMTWGTAASMVILESLLGAGAGFAARLLLSALPMAGQLMGGVGGLGMDSVMDPAGGTQPTALGAFLAHLSSMLIVATGTLTTWVAVLIRSFDALPPGAAAITENHIETSFTTFAVALDFAVVLAAPVAGAQLVGHLVLALAMRAAPKANIFFAIGFLVPLAIGSLAFYMSLPAMSGITTTLIEQSTEAFATWLTPSGAR